MQNDCINIKNNIRYYVSKIIEKLFKLKPHQACHWYGHCCNYGDFDCGQCKKMNDDIGELKNDTM